MVTHKKVLILSDDLLFMDTLAKLLSEFEGFLVINMSVNNFIDSDVRELNVNLIILDYFKVEALKNGLHNKLLELQASTPVVSIEIKNTDNDQLVNLGFSYIIRYERPIYFPKLLNDILRLMNDFKLSKPTEVRVGPYLFNNSLKSLTAQGNILIKLTEMETKILDYLYKNNSKVVEKDILLTEVWGYNSQVMTHTLETHIYRLRKKMDLYFDGANLLIGESGGYRLQL